MSGPEGEGQGPGINYMDTLVPVDFITDRFSDRLLLPPDQARDAEFMQQIASTYKRYSFDEVVVHVGYSRAEGQQEPQVDG